MAKIVNARRISQKAYHKQSIEQELAERLYRNFDRPDALRPLRATVKNVLEAMMNGPKPQLTQALIQERFLRVLAKYPPIGASAIPKAKGANFDSKGWMLSLFRHLNHFTAADCYDLIRLAGEWVEQGGLNGWGGFTNRGVTAAAEIKQAYRPGVPSAAQGSRVAQSGRRWESQALDPVAKVWADGKKSGVLKATHGKDFNGMTAIRDRVSADGKLPAPIRKHDSHATAGRELKRVAKKSTVLKIDRLFGLSEMCDISGTTSDVVFALDTWGGQHLSTIYYAFPLGAVVAGAHHSVLEVALALSLNKTVNYKIGFYRTLLPRDTVRNGGDCYRNVANSLYWAEQQMYIHELHFLRFYVYGEGYRGLVFERGEIPALKRSGLFQALKVLDVARNLGTMPGVHDLVTLGNRCDFNFTWGHVYDPLRRANLL